VNARILVLRGGALGDFLITLPALRLLRARWPTARIELAGHPEAGALGVLGGYLDAAHSQHESRWSALFSAAALPPAFADWLGSFDLVVNFWPDPDQTLASRFPLHSAQTYVSGTAMPAIAPAARHFCEPLRSLGLTTDDFRSRWPYPGATHVEAASHPISIAIHPGSGSASKNWPNDRWSELIARLDAPILIVLGEVERERWNASALSQLRAVSRQTVEVASELSLPELAVALKRCRLFLGHDSGVSHLAAAVGLPCILLFGPTDPAMWAPPGPHVQVIRRGATLGCIGVQDVLRAACRTAVRPSREDSSPPTC
jgi:ADP-heptose:LPS heptosyltransferase